MEPGRAVSISLGSVRDTNLMMLKKLNDAIFPFRYSARYYVNVLAAGEFAKLAYFNDICVGEIACRPEKKKDGTVCLYIMTIGVLAPYRRLGVGGRLMNYVLELASRLNICEFYLHTLTSNEDAIRFYKKFGFETTAMIKNYYTNMPNSPDCYVLTKNTTASTSKSEDK